MSTPDLSAATDRLRATIRGLPDADWLAATTLPGWSQAHVIAHLTLNAEGLAGVLEGAATGQPTSMYASQDARDADIETLAQEAPGIVRDRLDAACARFADAVDAMPADAWTGSFARVPGAPGRPTSAVLAMRHGEVEIHHADLGASYSADDWPAEFAAALLDDVSGDYDVPLTLDATDLGRTWTIGSPTAADPVVSGSAGRLGWWLTGRDGAGLTSSHGAPPELGAWR